MTKQENSTILIYLGPLIIIGLVFLCFIFPYAYVFLPMAGILIDSRTGKFTGTSTVLAVAIALTIGIGVNIIPLTLPLVLIPVAALFLLKKGIAPMESMGITAAIAAVSIAGGMYILSLIKGMNITLYLIQLALDGLSLIPNTGLAHYVLSAFALAFNGIESGSIDMTETLNSAMEFQSLQTSALVEIIEPYIETFVKFNIPGLLVKISLYFGLLSYGVPAYIGKLKRESGKQISKILEKAPDLPRFKDWDLPRWIKLPLILTMVLSLIAQFTSNEEVVVVISLTINSIVMGIGAIEGLALINFWLDKKGMAKGAIIALMVISFVLFGSLVSYLGILDMVTGLRRFLKARETILKDIKTQIDKNKDSDEEDKR